MTTDYGSKMKWWLITNEAGVARLYSGAYADDARQAAREHNPDLFGRGRLTAERQGNYAYASQRRGRRKEC